MLLLPIDYSKTKILNVKEKLLEGWRKREPRSALHVSDLNLCLRKTCMERLEGVQLSEKTIHYFHNGLGWHSYLEGLLGPDFQCEKEFLYHCKNGQIITAHPDAIYEKDGVKVIVEIKTTTRNTDKPSKHHISQAKSYAAITGADYAKLLYVRVCADSDPYFIEYLILFNYKNEEQEILEQLESSAGRLQLGISLGRPDLVPKDYQLNWLCKLPCQFKEKCDQMRIEAGEIKPKE